MRRRSNGEAAEGSCRKRPRLRRWLQQGLADSTHDAEASAAAGGVAFDAALEAGEPPRKLDSRRRPSPGRSVRPRNRSQVELVTRNSLSCCGPGQRFMSARGWRLHHMDMRAESIASAQSMAYWEGHFNPFLAICRFLSYIGHEQ
jgi:hypothetical protein